MRASLFQPLTNLMVRKHFLISNLVSCNLDLQFLILLSVDTNGCLFPSLCKSLTIPGDLLCFPGLTEQSQLFSVSSQATFSRAAIFLAGLSSSLSSWCICGFLHMFFQVCSCFPAINFSSFQR